MPSNVEKKTDKAIAPPMNVTTPAGVPTSSPTTAASAAQAQNAASPIPTVPAMLSPQVSLKTLHDRLNESRTESSSRTRTGTMKKVASDHVTPSATVRNLP